MTPYEYYSNLIKYKKKDVNSKLYDNGSLSHAGVKSYANNLTNKINTMKNYGYYNKLDNFYGPGKARYFYTKDEWDAYQRENERLQDKAKQSVKKSNEERIEKYGTNVEKAQLARRKEEEKATFKEREKQIQALKDKSSRNAKAVGNLIKFIQDAGGNTNEFIQKSLQESLGDDYDVTKDLKIGFKGHSIQPDLYEQLKEIEEKENELQRNKMYSRKAEDGIYTESRYGWEGYNEDAEKQIANLEYQKQKLYEEFNNRMYQDIMNAIDNLIENNDPRKTAAIKKALWEYTNTKSFKNYRKQIDDDLYRRIKSYALIMPNDSNTETWDNSKNIKSWDNGTTLYENVLKENVLKEKKI